MAMNKLRIFLTVFVWSILLVLRGSMLDAVAIPDKWQKPDKIDELAKGLIGKAEAIQTTLQWVTLLLALKQATTLDVDLATMSIESPEWDSIKSKTKMALGAMLQSIAQNVGVDQPKK